MSKKRDKEQIKKEVYLDNMFYEDEVGEHLTDNKEILNKRMELIKNHIASLIEWEEDKTSELFYRKSDILKNDNLLNLLIYAYDEDNIEQLNEKRLDECINDFNKLNNFFEDKNAFHIIETYGNYALLTKDTYGFYQMSDDITEQVIRDNNLNLDTSNDNKLEKIKETIKNAINDTWENKKEIITPSDLNKLSEEQNGINFKQFIFCEEYLKRGKIKPTCEYLGISRNTAYLWFKDEKVTKYLEQRKQEIKQETDDTFLQTYRTSFNELNKMIESDYIETGDKIKAIDTFLKHYENIEKLKQPLTTSED